MCVMRSLAALFVMLMLLSCSTSQESLDPGVRDFLLDSSASDFRLHGPQPAQVRKVRAGYLVTDEGTKQYVLCGEFLPAAGDEATQWTRFATIKTDPYEQWIGGQADNWCGRSSMVWVNEDLTVSLWNRLQ